MAAATAKTSERPAKVVEATTATAEFALRRTVRIAAIAVQAIPAKTINQTPCRRMRLGSETDQSVPFSYDRSPLTAITKTQVIDATAAPIDSASALVPLVVRAVSRSAFID
jgi:hypothetical protein